MTIPEASRLVIQAGTLTKGGEVFVLDMGEPVKIVDLAKNLIHLSGYTEEEIAIRYNGIRPGEKMYEELLGEGEVLPGQVFEKIYVGRTMEVNGQIGRASCRERVKRKEVPRAVKKNTEESSNDTASEK